jgi:hypothetical protein
VAAFVLVSKTILIGTTWSAPSTAPGPIVPLPTIAGTISSSSDLTPYSTAADTGMATAMQDVTNFASGGYMQVIPGITTGDNIVIQANSDYAASQIYAIVNTTLGGLSRAGSSPVYVDIKQTSAARGATNPSFVAAVYISSWKPGSGSVGNKAAMELTLTVTGQFAHLAS